MSGTSFLRRVSFHTFRRPFTYSKDEPQLLEHEPSQKPPVAIPESQTVLLLHAARRPYEVVKEYPVPQVRDDREILVRTQAIGLNPIDWKAPDFNFAIPELPYISGRELAGEVVLVRPGQTRLKPGDRVLAISTDYRDLRKAAYQEYVVAFDYNTVRLPPRLSVEEGSTLGVAFVAAALALGVCMGVDFSSVLGGPDLYSLVRQVPAESLAADLRNECHSSLRSYERARPGDWLAIWGGSSTSANLTHQLAKLAGLRTIVTVDKAKHGLRLSNHPILRPDLLVDSHDPVRAVAIIRANVAARYGSSSGTAATTTTARHDENDEDGRRLLFAIDTRGRESATSLMHALTPADDEDGHSLNGNGNCNGNGSSQDTPPSPPATPHDSASISDSTTATTTNEETFTAAHLSSSSPSSSSSISSPSSNPLHTHPFHRRRGRRAHLVGLAGLPKQPLPAPPGPGTGRRGVVVFHTVPIKLFHESRPVGEALVRWLERLLAAGMVAPPDVLGVERGLASVNPGLDRMRKGEVSGGRLVVRVDRGGGHLR